ncbi:YceI family protein [Caulobacter sp. UNC279MFTsu5.1]|uniref:YceI family protein n=1 Tax=Caulobacter sp. UNC279MFTsu5.1 TaxID=1502775 RepID=UPI0008F3FA18|nr:YceI family protein [Caulobacter sp. UNC279MFTsu5.1]SFI67835.1 Cytochrome b561 [Caulobacter sp. UNC279MFTsu5.1]
MTAEAPIETPSAAGRPPRYTTVAILLHWLIAAAILFQIILGWRMGDEPKGPATYAIFQLHKSIGITILLLSLARLAWRLFHKPPPHPAGQPRWETIASQIVHVAFYVIMIGLPVTGWIMVSASKLNIPTLLYGTVPWPHLPGLPELAAGPKHVWYKAGEISHGLLVKTTYLLLALHLGAAAKHQILDRDEVLGHMAPGARPGWREPRAWLAAAGLIAVVAAGYLYNPAVKRPVAPAAPAEVADAQAPAAPAAPPAAGPAPTAPAADAAPVAPLEPDTALKDPVAWAVAKSSTLGFTASWAGEAIEGQFKRWTADILFSPDALDRSKLTVSIDMSSAATGDDQRDSSLPSGDFFDTANHPKATFTASKFRKTGDGRFVADGTLDLRGVKKPVSLPFALKIDGDTATARGVTTLDRTAFGVGQGEWASTDQIGGKVKVSFAITAKRK